MDNNNSKTDDYLAEVSMLKSVINSAKINPYNKFCKTYSFLKGSTIPPFILITTYSEALSEEVNRSRIVELILDLKSHELRGEAVLGRYNDSINDKDNKALDEIHAFVIHNDKTDISVEGLPDYISGLCEKFNQDFCIYSDGIDLFNMGRKGLCEKIESLKNLDAKIETTNEGKHYFSMNMEGINSIYSLLRKRKFEFYGRLGPSCFMNAVGLGSFGLL